MITLADLEALYWEERRLGDLWYDMNQRYIITLALAVDRGHITRAERERERPIVEWYLRRYHAAMRKNMAMHREHFNRLIDERDAGRANNA